MKVYVTRASVAAGDDADAPHPRTFHFPEGSTLEAIVTDICSRGYLASIQGGLATWSVSSNFPLAVAAQQWPAPRMLKANLRLPLDFEGDTLRLHFSYHTQIDPETVFAVLRELTLRAG
jgi:hypothetical protein